MKINYTNRTSADFASLRCMCSLTSNVGVNVVQRFAFGKQPGLAATGTHVTYGITQCYLPPGRCDILTLTPAARSWYSIERPRRYASGLVA